MVPSQRPGRRIKPFFSTDVSPEDPIARCFSATNCCRELSRYDYQPFDLRQQKSPRLLPDVLFLGSTVLQTKHHKQPHIPLRVRSARWRIEPLRVSDATSQKPWSPLWKCGDADSTVVTGCFRSPLNQASFRLQASGLVCSRYPHGAPYAINCHQCNIGAPLP